MLRLLDIYFHNLKLQNDNYTDLFINESFDLIEQVKTVRDFSIEEKCLAEYEAFDYLITRHPLDFYHEQIAQKNITGAADMEKFNGRRIKMIGWYMASKRIRTRKGDIMKFLSLEDLTGTFEAVIFPNVYSRVAEQTMSMGPYLVEGKVDMNNLIVDRLELLADKAVKAQFEYESIEYKYKPDDEGLTEEDFSLAKSIDFEKLREVYAA